MQRFHIETPMDDQGLITTYIATEIRDIIDALKEYDSNSSVPSSDIVFDGSNESLHLLQGSLLVNGMDKKIWNPIIDRHVDDPDFTYISQLDY